MLSTDPSPLTHSWPLFDRDQQLDLGCCFNWSGAAASVSAVEQEALARQGIGIWECDLGDNSLTWSAGVHDLFGLPREHRVSRATAVSLYREPSRAAMEKLRAYALKHCRGFTLDVEILPANGGHRWIRLAAAPLCVDHRPVRLHGFKRDVTHEYHWGGR